MNLEEHIQSTIFSPNSVHFLLDKLSDLISYFIKKSIIREKVQIT